MQRRLRVGIIGVGAIGRFHLEAAQRVGATVVALAVSSDNRARATSETFGIPAHADYHRLLEDPSIDVVHICTPDYLHFQMVSDALRTGKHVICEKPLALSSSESASLLRLAEESGLVHAIGFNNRFFPLIREARARIAQGELGRVFAVRGAILEDSLLSTSAYDWRLDLSKGGESCAMSTIGSHLIDLSCFVVGSPITAVCADFTTVHSSRRRAAIPRGDAAGPTPPLEEVPIRSEEVASLLVRFASGARGVLCLSRATAGRRYKITLEIDGTKASLAWDSESPNQLWQGHDDQPNQIILRDPPLLSDAARLFASYPGAYQEAFADTIKGLVCCVYDQIAATMNRTRDFPDFADGYAAQVVHDAVMASAQSGQWVRVPEIRGFSYV